LGLLKKFWSAATTALNSNNNMIILSCEAVTFKRFRVVKCLSLIAYPIAAGDKCLFEPVVKQFRKKRRNVSGNLLQQWDQHWVGCRTYVRKLRDSGDYVTDCYRGKRRQVYTWSGRSEIGPGVSAVTYLI